MHDPFASSRRMGKVVLGAIGLRVAFSLILVVALPILRRALHELGTFGMVIRVSNGVRLALTMLVVVLSMIWVRSEIVALRSSGVGTKTTPLMAILGWFIPFANFVLPLLSAREVFVSRLPRASSALPILWWVSYLALIVTNNVILPFPIGLLVTLLCFGLWFAMVFLVMRAPAVPRIMPSAPPPQWPYPAQAR